MFQPKRVVFFGAILLAAFGAYYAASGQGGREKIDIRARREAYRLIGPGCLYNVSVQKGLGQAAAVSKEPLTAGEAFSLRLEYTAGADLQPGDAFVVVIPYPWPRPTSTASPKCCAGTPRPSTTPGSS